MSFSVIVVPTDFSDHSLRALPYALGLAEKYDAEVKILYVNEPALQVSDMAWVGVDDRALKDEHVSEARQNMERIMRDQIPPEITVQTEVRSGDAVEEIIRFAGDAGADLIVMATHGRSGLSHILMGSTAEQVIRKASCPVLTLKHPMQVTSHTQDGS
jgi:nucleotide-binding universal stress UspA family protein